MAEVAMPMEFLESKCHKTKFDTVAHTPVTGSND
jgi:hypothetical protein